jgi:hypothetical protein
MLHVRFEFILDDLPIQFHFRSVNEVICHGIPDLRPLQDGDILNSKSIESIKTIVVFNSNF